MKIIVASGCDLMPLMSHLRSLAVARLAALPRPAGNAGSMNEEWPHVRGSEMEKMVPISSFLQSWNLLLFKSI